VQDAELASLAEEIGRRLAEAGAIVVCGGLGGVMEAAARGARAAGGDVIGILPSEDPADANEHVTHLVATGIGHARNLAVATSGDVVIAIGGEWGTLAEIALARRVGRPVIVVRGWKVRGRGAMRDAPGIQEAGDAAEAVRLALEAIEPR
jgi:uncharacterized protein (TIGR00725 family)